MTPRCNHLGLVRAHHGALAGARRVVPFIPVVLLWAAVAEAGSFPRAFFRGPATSSALSAR